MLTPTSRRYLAEFGSAMAGYVLVVLISGAVVRAHPDAGWRYLVAVLPVVPALAALVAVLRHIGRIDELERRIMLEALAFGALLTGFGTFTYGFLDSAGAPRLSMVWVFPLLIVLWGVGAGIAQWRYR